MDEVVKFMREAQGELGYWYVASVYTQDPEGPEHAFENAKEAGAWLVERGVHVFVPITHSHPISLKLPAELNTHAVWMTQDKPLVHKAVGIAVVRMPRWENSKGMGMERKWSAELGKPEVHLPWPLPANDLKVAA